MTTLEKNKLIAEFMGGKPDKPESEWYYFLDEGRYFKLKDMQYHESWEWLMPVLNDVTAHPKWDEFNDQDLWDKLCTFDLKGCYERVVEFLRWLREDKPKKAYLVKASFTTRLIVDANAKPEDIVELAAVRIAEKATYEFQENLESIEEDTECPYDPETDNNNG